MHVYDAHTRGLSVDPVSMDLEDADVVIVEGVTAMHSASLARQADLKIVVEAPDTEVRQRFDRFYSWKGMEQADIEQLRNERFVKEAAAVVGEYCAADIRVNPFGRSESEQGV